MKQKTLFAAFLLLFCATSLWASNTSVDGIWYDFDQIYLTATVTYRGSNYDYYSDEYSGSVIIPEKVNYDGRTYTVTSIGSSAFSACSSLTSVIIPNNVISIGSNAFAGCSSLSSVSIPNSVTDIERYAFSGCSSLSSMAIPNSVINIDIYAFAGCSGLASVTIPNSVASIEDGAFLGCKISSINFIGTIEDWCNKTWSPSNVAGGYQLLLNGELQENVIIPNAVSGIQDYTFSGCSSMTSLTIHNSVTGIGSSAFSGCSSLTSLTIPNSVTSIGYAAFAGCSSLTSIVIEQGNGTYDSRDNCNAIIETASNTLIAGCKNTIIPNSVTSIGERAFGGCSSLTSVTIPNSIERIGEYAFSGCSSLTSVSLNSVYIISKRKSLEFIFGSQVTEYILGDEITSIGERAFEYCENLTSIDIPNSVTRIADNAFRGCSGLTSVTIPNSVTSIGESAFSGCSGLTSVTINSNPIVSKSYKENLNLQNVFGAQVVEYILGNEITQIGKFAFYKCSNLKSINIPDNVKSIGEYAFFGCNSLPLIDHLRYADTYLVGMDGDCLDTYTIRDGTKYIGTKAFYGCSGLTSMIIPNSVASIGESAFSGCSGLTSVTINSNPIVSKSYKENLNLQNVFGAQVVEYILGNEITQIGKYAFYKCSNLKSINIPDNVKSIGEYAFFGCNSLPLIDHLRYADTYLIGMDGDCLDSYTIRDGTKFIGSGAFSGCSSLTSMNIPNSVTSIGCYAFSNCSGLTSVTIPENITYVGYAAYAKCDNLSSVTWSAKSAQIDDVAFGYVDYGSYLTAICSPIKTFIISDDVEVIPSWLCRGLKELTSLTIPNSVTSIGYGAFTGCSGLTSVTIPNNVTSIGSDAFSGCSRLTSIEIPNSVTSIGDYAFYGCSGIKNVTLKSDVTTIGEYAFNECQKLESIYVPCGSLENYQNAEGWSQYASLIKYHPFPYEITPIAEHGSISVNKDDYIPCENQVIKCTAIPDGGYQFAKWSDGNTANPRAFTLSQDTTLKAIFDYALEGRCGKDSALTWKMDTTTMTLRIYGNGELTSNYTYDRNMKSLFIGDGITSIGDKAFDGCSSLTSLTVGEGVTSIGSMAFYDCENLSSVVWNAISCSDFYVNYPYIYTPFSYMYKNYDTEFTAPIESFTFGNKVKRIPAGLCYGLDKLTTIVIPEGCDTICDNAFKYCSKIKTITLPSTLNYIGENAFTTERIIDVYNYSLTPQDMEGKGFDSWVSELRGVLASARLYVPMQSLELYRNAFFWGYFGNILPIQSTTVETNSVNVSATETTATVVWPQINNAATYELVIKDQNGNVVCTLVFDSEGKLVSIAFSAPSRDNSTEQAQAAGFSFTVTGLESGTTYDLTITAKDSNDQTLQTTTQTFTTEGLTSVEDVETAIDLNKVIRNGQLFILRGDKTYTVRGQKVR